MLVFDVYKIESLPVIRMGYDIHRLSHDKRYYLKSLGKNPTPAHTATIDVLTERGAKEPTKTREVFCASFSHGFDLIEFLKSKLDLPIEKAFEILFILDQKRDVEIEDYAINVRLETSLKEVAHFLHEKYPAVKSRYMRALQKMKTDRLKRMMKELLESRDVSEPVYKSGDSDSD
jgi:hypothetical protein